MRDVRYNKNITSFIHSLEKSTLAKVDYAIRLLEEFGEGLMMPHSKRIHGNLFELRIGGRQKVRIFYTFYDEDIFLLHGFIKKTSKIPKKELEIGLQRLRELDNI